MSAENSHHSWRPLTVLTFRYLKGWSFANQLTMHRIVNILTHAAAAEVVGILATQVWIVVLEDDDDEDEDDEDDIDDHGDDHGDDNNEDGTKTARPTNKRKNDFDNDNIHSVLNRRLLLLRLLVKIVFALHPTHVEVTANAANRNHILAVLCSCILCSTTIPLMTVFLPTLIAGYLASETFLFQVPPVMVTMVVIAYNNNQRQKHLQRQTTNRRRRFTRQSELCGRDPTRKEAATGREEIPPRQPSPPSSLLDVLWEYLLAMISQLPRLALLVISIGAYYGGRAYYNTLDIPQGLIRPAENPFYKLVGPTRVLNYLYVVCIHIAKSVPGLDPVGFSHEYGFDCIPVLNGINDERFVLVYGVGAAMLLSLFVALVYRPDRYLGIVAIYWAWTLVTLFPISGILKVGTFVSDRIVVASTVPVSWILGRLLYSYVTKWFADWPAKPLQVAVISWCFVTSYMTIHSRALQWMDSVSLLNSALVTCPRFAKAHMEISKIHSGLYPTLFDLKKSRYHLEVAREIDPDMCDVHQQFAHVAIQENKYLEYEEEITQAVLCPFTMGGALPMWQRYWKVAIDSVPAGTPQRADVEERQAHYTLIIQQGVKEAQEKEAAEEAKAEAKQQRRKLEGSIDDSGWWGSKLFGKY